MSELASPPVSLDDARGWFIRNDQLVFEWILGAQCKAGVVGDLLELGVSEDKSAIHLGRFLRPGEILTVCDLFEDVSTAEGVPDYIRSAYSSLSQATFERKPYANWDDPVPLQDAVVRQSKRRPDLRPAMVPLGRDRVVRLAPHTMTNRPAVAAAGSAERCDYSSGSVLR